MLPDERPPDLEFDFAICIYFFLAYTKIICHNNSNTGGKPLLTMAYSKFHHLTFGRKLFYHVNFNSPIEKLGLNDIKAEREKESVEN